ncbi:10576_t:CDS:2, partial [Gigaspora margarita]
ILFVIAEINTKDDNVDDNTEIVDLIRHSDNYINTKEPDDSVEIHQFKHQEALDALDTVYQYLLQQNNNMIEYINTILKIIKKVRNEFEYNITKADMFEETKTDDFELDISESNK